MIDLHQRSLTAQPHATDGGDADAAIHPRIMDRAA
jgi:hypothetical protein